MQELNIQFFFSDSTRIFTLNCASLTAGENESSQPSNKKLYHGGPGKRKDAGLLREVQPVKSLWTSRTFPIVNTGINMSSVFIEPIGKAIKLQI